MLLRRALRIFRPSVFLITTADVDGTVASSFARAATFSSASASARVAAAGTTTSCSDSITIPRSRAWRRMPPWLCFSTENQRASVGCSASFDARSVTTRVSRFAPGYASSAFSPVMRSS